MQHNVSNTLERRMHGGPPCVVRTAAWRCCSPLRCDMLVCAFPLCLPVAALQMLRASVAVRRCVAVRGSDRSHRGGNGQPLAALHAAAAGALRRGSAGHTDRTCRALHCRGSSVRATSTRHHRAADAIPYRSLAQYYRSARTRSSCSACISQCIFCSACHDAAGSSATCFRVFFACSQHAYFFFTWLAAAGMLTLSDNLQSAARPWKASVVTSGWHKLLCSL